MGSFWCALYRPLNGVQNVISANETRGENAFPTEPFLIRSEDFETSGPSFWSYKIYSIGGAFGQKIKKPINWNYMPVIHHFLHLW